MAMKVAVNGARIKTLRAEAADELPQKKLAALCGISERQLRRIENGNLAVSKSVLRQLAAHLKVEMPEIAFGLDGSQLAPSQKNSQTALTKEEDSAEIHIPRHTTTFLGPVPGAHALYDMAANCQQIVPHVLVDAAPAQMEMIEECLDLLNAISRRKWSAGEPIPPDAYDATAFPEMARRKRLSELFVLLKGHDIRIVADQLIYDYPAGEDPWLPGQRFCFQLVIAFAPPRGQYEEDSLTVPFDGGRDQVLPRKPIF